MTRIFIAAAILILAGIALYAGLARTGQFALTRAALIEKYRDPESRFVNVRDIEFHYKDEGRGPPVLLLHGSFGTLKTWDGVVGELKNDYRLIRIDQPPTGLSGELPPSAEGLSLEDMIARFLDEIGIDRVSLAGTSSGGIIAYRFAAKYPERTAALILSNTPSAVVDNDATGTPPTLDLLIKASALLRYQPEIYWRSLLESLYADPSRLTAGTVRAYYDFNRRRRGAPMIRSLMARVNDTAEIEGVLAQVTAPTLVLWGVPDRVLPLALGERLRDKLTQASPEFVILENTGHYPPAESPGLVAAQMAAFLARHNGPER